MSHRAGLDEQPDLFALRSALFFTPTSALPERHIGNGPMEAHLPIATPIFSELDDHRYASPRTWVDLLQRATGRLRWQALSPAVVTFTRYDYRAFPELDVICGLKPLLDALKAETTGRRDGRVLHYFGAIVDDDREHARMARPRQVLVPSPAEARIVVRVEPLPT